MKKFIPGAAALTLTLTLTANLFALRPGDAVEELTGVRWMTGAPFSMLPPAKPQTNDPEYRAVVFLLTRAQTTDDTLALLNHLRRTFAGKVRFAIVTPDSETDVKTLLERNPGFDLSFGVDSKRELTSKYLGALRILPLAFITDKSGEIIWAGEAVDLGETLRKCLDGDFNQSAQRKIVPLLEELQTLLSGDNEAKMRRTVEEIFRLEPGQPSALRIRCFVLESSGRAGEALALIRSQIARAPKLARLHLEALNLIARNPALDTETAAAVRSYREAVTDDADFDNQIAWLLLNRNEESPEALKNAVLLTERAKRLLKPNATAALRGSCLNTQALLAYRLGKVEEAARLQEQAEKLFRSADLSGAAQTAAARTKYYRTVLELK